MNDDIQIILTPEQAESLPRTVDPILTKQGLSYRYRSEQEGGMIRVTCVVSHRDGHSEEVTLSAGSDSTGNKNTIQAVGSTITYLQRYTLKAALGLAASADDDGKTSDQRADEFITIEQVNEIRDLIDEVGADLQKFLEVGKIDSLSEIRTVDFPDAIALLKRKGQRS